MLIVDILMRKDQRSHDALVVVSLKDHILLLLS